MSAGLAAKHNRGRKNSVFRNGIFAFNRNIIRACRMLVFMPRRIGSRIIVQNPVKKDKKNKAEFKNHP